MPDARTLLEQRLDRAIGPPLYYCAECLRGVKVTEVPGAEPGIVRPCGKQCGHQIMAPRKATACGEGGLNLKGRATVAWRQIAAALTGRCV